MRLIGMLDSPYVRRTAISLAILNIKFTLEQLSVFSKFDEFSNINPVVKAPTLVTNDGVALVDSSLIIEYAAKNLCGRSSIEEIPADQAEEYYRVLGLSLAACEKAIQVVYERVLRPADKVHGPWLDRISRQAKAAFGEIEREYAISMHDDLETLRQPDIAAAVVWMFARRNIPDLIDEESHSALAALSRRLEERREFLAYPYPDD